MLTLLAGERNLLRQGPAERLVEDLEERGGHDGGVGGDDEIAALEAAGDRQFEAVATSARSSDVASFF